MITRRRKIFKRDGCKTILSINLGLFERDKEGKQNDLRHSGAMVKVILRQPDEVAAKKDKFRENIVLPPSQRTGFTLLEVMLAVSLSLIIFFSVAYTYEISQNAYLKTDVKAEITQNGRTIIDRLVRELRQTPDIVTNLPINNNDPATLAHEIIFQDGHDTSQIKYIRYFLDTPFLMKRQIIAYSFDDAPDTYVSWQATDINGNPPTPHILGDEDKIIGEYVQDIEFWGENLININLYLNKNNQQEIIYTAVYGRNS
mgnify:CR=1 FL=1